MSASVELLAHRAPSSASGIRVLVLVLSIAGLLVSGATLFAIDVDDQGLALNLAATGTTLILAAMFAADYQREGNALSPICISSILLFLLFPLHAWLTQDSQTLTVLIGSDADMWRTKALLVTTVSVPFLLFGFRSRLPERFAAVLPSPGWQIDDLASPTRSKLIILYALGFLPRVIAAAAGQGFHWENPEQQLQELQFILSILGNLPLFACTWFIIIGLRHKRRDWLMLGLGMLGVELTWSLMSGSRMRVITPLMTVVVAYAYAVKPFTARRVAVIVGIFAFVLLPFITAFKVSYFDRLGTIQREGVTAGTVIDSLSDASGSELALAKGDGPLDLLAERFHGTTSLALVIRYTPEKHDYYYGVPYFMVIPQILVPRVIWPTKPSMNPFGEVFRYEYWGRERGDPTSIGVSQLGDLWVNLHLVGTILGTALFGAIIAFLFRHLKYGLKGPTIFPIIVFAIHLPLILHAFENAFDGILAGLPKSLFIYFLLAWALSRRARAPRVRALGR